MPTLLHRLAAHADATPGRPFAVVWEDNAYRVLSYANLQAESRRIAGALGGHPPGGIVFIVLRHGPMLYPAYLGAMMAGLVPSFLPFPTPKQDAARYFASHRELFQRTPPAAVITYAELLGPLRDVLPPGTALLDIATLDAAPIAPDLPGPEPDPEPDPGATALLQHSSGTTGLKKGVALTYRQIAAQAEAYAPVAGLGAASVVASWLPLYHDMGLFTGFLLPLTLGACVVSIDAFDWVRQPTLLLRLVQEFRATHAWLPDFAFHHILAAAAEGEAFDLAALQSLVSCSEPVKPATLRAFAARFALPPDRLRACYAMAETCFAVSQSAGHPPSLTFDRRTLVRNQRPMAASPGPAVPTVELASNGPPLAGIEIAIAHDGGIETAETTLVGEIVVRGPFVFDQYHNAPDLTAAAHVDGWYRTGDMGFRHAGEAYVCGRLKELIIVHGRNYYCHDIEAAVAGVAGIVPGRVVAVGTDAPGAAGEELLLIAEPESDDPAGQPMLRRAMKMAVFTELELMPRQIEFVPRGWLVKTTSGKFSRVENLRRLRERQPEPAA